MNTNNDQSYQALLVWEDKEQKAHYVTMCEPSKDRAINAVLIAKNSLNGKLIYSWIMSERQVNNPEVFGAHQAVAMSNEGKVSCFVFPENSVQGSQVEVFVSKHLWPK